MTTGREGTDGVHKALCKLMKVNIERTPFVRLVLITLENGSDTTNYVRTHVQHLFTEKQGKLTVEADRMDYADFPNASIYDLVLVKQICATLTEEEKIILLERSHNPNCTIKGLPFWLFSQFLQHPPNPREEFVQVEITTLSYEDVRLGWDCARFASNCIFVVPLDMSFYGDERCRPQFNNRLKEIFTRIKMSVKTQHHNPRVILTSIRKGSEESCIDIGASLKRTFCTQDPSEEKAFDELLCLDETTKQPLFVIDAQERKCYNETVLWKEVFRLLTGHQSSYNSPFPVSAVIMSKQLKFFVEQTQRRTVTIAMTDVKNLQLEILNKPQESQIKPTLRALQQSGHIISVKGQQGNMFVVYDVEGFIEYGKHLQQYITSSSNWYDWQKNLEIYLRQKQKLDEDLALFFMKRLHLLVSVPHHLIMTQESPVTPAQYNAQAAAAEVDRKMIYFPNLLSQNWQTRSDMKGEELYVDFHGYLPLPFFIYFMKEFSKKYSGGSSDRVDLRILNPFQGVIQRHQANDVMMEYDPGNSWIRFIVR